MEVQGLILDIRNKTDDPWYIKKYSWMCIQQSDKIISNLAVSRKANCGRQKTFFGFELGFGKIKKLRMERKGIKSKHR